MDEKKVLKKSAQIVGRKIEDKTVLLPLSKSNEKRQVIYTLNETASLAWELIDGKRTLGQIKEKLMEQFNVSEKRLEDQIDSLVKDLKSIKAIQ